MNFSANSQTGSDYYIPLCVGNFTSYYTPENGNYGGRISVIHIKKSEIYNQETLYLQEGYELGDYSPNDTNIYHQFWLRKDNYGNILMVAINMEENGNLADAYFLPTPLKLIPNEYLTLGYSRSIIFGDETIHDTVISISATVGNYTNCIVIRETGITDSINVIDEMYYAPSIGLVKTQRLFHREENHTYTCNITNVLATNCYVGLENELDNKNSISLYPNPSNNYVNLKIQNSNNESLTLNIYNTMGSIVKTLRINDKDNQVDVSDLTNGIYFMSLSSDNYNAKQKLVINK